MPAGAEVTVPVPLPASTVVNVRVSMTKVAVTDCACDIVTTQVDVPEQPAPLQPPNVDWAFGAAVSVTTVPDV